MQPDPLTSVLGPHQHPIVLVCPDISIRQGSPQKVAVPPHTRAGDLIDYVCDLLKITDRSELTLIRWGAYVDDSAELFAVQDGEKIVLTRKAAP